MSNSQWAKNPIDNDWNNTKNWESEEVPDGVAAFADSSITQIQFSKDSKAIIQEIIFKKGAAAFSFTFGSHEGLPGLTIAGSGVLNESMSIQQFRVMATGVSNLIPRLKFINSANAGDESIVYYAGPESLDHGSGGGIITFFDKSTAGSANFTVKTGTLAPPTEKSTVGAIVGFNDSANAGTGTFTLYGTLGTDGDTFGNVVFNNIASADHATFINLGGTVSGGDGGNTQFYNDSSSGFGIFINHGGTYNKSNGGDVAFDGNATAANGQFYNRVAEVTGANGGVTSFNNNPPAMGGIGANAGNAIFHNYGAIENSQGGGGHTELTAKYGSPSAANGNFHNYGSVISSRSSAGHTVLTVNLPCNYAPTAGNGLFWNYPALSEYGAAGNTQFSIYGSGDPEGRVPTAENATFYNLGAYIQGAAGGFTELSDDCTAANATFIAESGINGGKGGSIIFSGNVSGASCRIQLIGNGEFDISQHSGEVSIGTLNLTGGIIRISLGKETTLLTVNNEVNINLEVSFSFCQMDNGEFEINKSYAILKAPNLNNYPIDQFTGNCLDGIVPQFEIKDNTLFVAFKVA